MKTFQPFDNALLNQAGLNRQAVFNLDELPAELGASIRAACTAPGAYRQVILIGHAGRKLWESVCASGIDSDDPIDDFTIATTRRWFAECLRQNAFEILYPGIARIGLQRLGELAGWHRPAPFMVGIDSEWGTWFAYRALVLADTGFAPTRSLAGESPCAACRSKVCVSSCPGAALDGGQFDFKKCAAYRKQDGSRCKTTCMARISCPVGSIHRYCDEQMRHSYSRSMQAIERFY